MKTEREKQLLGEFFNPSDKEIIDLQTKSRKLMREFNSEFDLEKRFKIMQEWFHSVGSGCYIEPNFYCDFGCNLTLGQNVYMNANCSILDSAEVTIGDNTMIATNVQICTPFHPITPEERLKPDNECAKSIIIGKNCWIGAGAIILPGIIIGDGSTVGAGSVVTKNVPERTVVAGNPAKIIKKV